MPAGFYRSREWFRQELVYITRLFSGWYSEHIFKVSWAFYQYFCILYIYSTYKNCLKYLPYSEIYCGLILWIIQKRIYWVSFLLLCFCIFLYIFMLIISLVSLRTLKYQLFQLYFGLWPLYQGRYSVNKTCNCA